MTPAVKVGQRCSSRSQTQIREAETEITLGTITRRKRPTGPTPAACQQLQVLPFHLATLRKTASNVEAPPAAADVHVSSCDVLDGSLAQSLRVSLLA